MSEWTTYLRDLLPGLRTSFELLVCLVVIGSPIAIGLALAQLSRHRSLRWASIAVVEVARGMPSLILLYLVYFGLPSTGLTLGAFTAAAIALGLNFAGYTSDSFKSGLAAVPSGQHEAAAALGLGRFVTLRRIILPQAIRIVTPPMLSYVIVYFQTTSVAFAISVPELMSKAYSVASVNFEYLDLFILAGLLYAAISIPGSQLVALLEKRGQSLTE